MNFWSPHQELNIAVSLITRYAGSDTHFVRLGWPSSTTGVDIAVYRRSTPARIENRVSNPEPVILLTELCIKYSVRFHLLWILEQGCTIKKKKTRSHLKIPGARRVIWSKFHTEDPQLSIWHMSIRRWFDPSWCHWNFLLTQNPSDRTVALGSTQPLTEMSTRSIFWGLRRPVHKADNLTTILRRCHEIWEP